MSVRDLIIVGAGPSGLSAAIAAKKRHLDYLVIEQGTLVNSIYRFPPQMVFFTTPELLEIGGLPFVSPFEKPTRVEALKYYRKVVDTYDLQISYEETVLSVERETTPAPAEFSGWSPESSAPSPEPLVLSPEPLVPSPESPVLSPEPLAHFVVESRDRRGVTRAREARHVIFAIGYYDHPNLLNVPGEDMPHVSHYYSEPHAYYRQRVVIVGGGNSAAESALELYRAGAHVTLVHRGPALKSTIKYWVRPDIENRIKEESIGARFNALVREIRPTSILVAGESGNEEIPADAVFLLTGYRADSALMTRAGIQLNERDAPVHHPETFETNAPGLFVAGGAIAGVDTGTIFIENGRFHGEKIVEVIARRL